MKVFITLLRQCRRFRAFRLSKLWSVRKKSVEMYLITSGLLAILLLLLLIFQFRLPSPDSTEPPLQQHQLLNVFRRADLPRQKRGDKKEEEGEDIPWQVIPLNAEEETPMIQHLGILSSRNGTGWFEQECDRKVQLRPISVPGFEGPLNFYIYNSTKEDLSATRRALRGWYFEEKEIAQFLNLTKNLPLIDIGANLGLVTLQAAKQGRRVVAVEPVPQNALRLCRSVLDFGHASLVHVIRNAVSSGEGRVSLGMNSADRVTTYAVKNYWESLSVSSRDVVAYSIHLDRLLELLPFERAALKIDVEGHEGHVLAGAERLFRQVDIPVVWLEWQHVKEVKGQYGGAFLLDFLLHARDMEPRDLMTGQSLDAGRPMDWPFSVLWVKRERGGGERERQRERGGDGEGAESDTERESTERELRFG